MKALFVLTQSPGLNLYRCMNFIKYFKMIKPTVFPPWRPDIVWNWEAELSKNKDFSVEIAKQIVDKDVIVMQRCTTLLGACALISIAREYKKTLWLEIDDYAFNVDSANPSFVPMQKGEPAYDAFYTQLEECDGIITSTDNLRVKYQKFCMKEFGDAKNIRIVANGIDFKLWSKLKPPKKKKGIRIGWQGSHHHFDDLKILMEVIPHILKKHKNVEFHMFGLCPDFIKQDRVVFHEAVTIDKYPQAITDLNLDIILAPLWDTEFNRGKSNLRILEAGVMKKPVIASGNKNLPYASIIVNNQNGLLAKGTVEWIGAIEKLIANPQEGKVLGKNLYKSVKKYYDVKDIALEYEAILI